MKFWYGVESCNTSWGLVRDCSHRNYLSLREGKERTFGLHDAAEKYLREINSRVLKMAPLKTWSYDRGILLAQWRPMGGFPLKNIFGLPHPLVYGGGVPLGGKLAVVVLHKLMNLYSEKLPPLSKIRVFFID
jgi:hypothetical protein